MKKKNLIRIATFCMASVLAFTPVNASAAALLKKGSRGTAVTMVQTTLKGLGYFTYPKATGYYGSNTIKAVKKFQREQGIIPDGIIGKITRKALMEYEASNKDDKISLISVAYKENDVTNIAPDKVGDLDWFKKVQYIFKRGDVAEVMDVETGRTFYLKRTFGTNHADVEPLTKEDSNTIKNIWGGWSWTRRAVVVKVNGYIIAASLAAMPHAGKDSAPAVQYVSGRSGGYGWGQNLDAVKNNGADGVLDLHFKSSRGHSTNLVNRAHQTMVTKAAKYINDNY